MSLLIQSHQVCFGQFLCPIPSSHSLDCHILLVLVAVQMFSRSRTVHRIGSGQLPDTAAYASGTCIGPWAYAAHAVIRWEHFSVWNDIMLTSLKVWHHVKNPTPSIDALHIYLKNSPAKFHPDPVWNNGALSFFEEHRLNKNNKKKKKKKMISSWSKNREYRTVWHRNTAE